MAYRNHLGNGNIQVRHKDTNVTTSLNSAEFDLFLTEMDRYEYTVGYIPPGFEHRADLISDLFYDTPTLDWLICWFNNIYDPFQQLNVRDRILIPKVV
jgi:hypothetical protein